MNQLELSMNGRLGFIMSSVKNILLTLFQKDALCNVRNIALSLLSMYTNLINIVVSVLTE